jgi:hypothetical protein
MRNLLLAATAFAAVSFGAEAAPLLSSTASSSLAGLSTTCNTSTGTGLLTSNCSGGGFSAVALTASAPPLLNAPDLSATTLTVTTAALASATTLTVDIASTGFSFAGGPVQALLTVNNLIGAGTGPFTLSAITPLGTQTHTFNGAGSDAIGPVNLGAFTNDSAHFVLTFGASALPQSIDATIEIQGVAAPEPAGLAILGVGLLGLGMVSSRKRSTGSDLTA